MNRTPSLKLSKDEKREVKARLQMLRSAGGEVFHFEDERMTVAVRPAAGVQPSFVYVTVSHCAEHEPKFRKSLGTLFVLDRMEYGTPMSVKIGACESLKDVAANIVSINAR